MACYHPLKAFQPSPGAKLKFVHTFDEINRWQFLYDNQSPDDFVQALKVKCGQCIGCRMTYSRNWAIRCCLEALMHPKDSCWFVTLTYDDEHVPKSFACDPETGEVTYETQTLVKSDLQKFFKRFRKNLKKHYGVKKIRYFACGEYGSISKRPHYHFILFGLPYDPSFFTRCPVQNSGHLMLDCKPIQESWQYGFSPVEEMTFDSAAYVAGYMLKKVKGKEADLYYKSHGIAKEFSVMSTKPGIAGSYFDMYGDQIYEKDSLCRRFGNMDFTPKPPSYFDNLFAAHHPEEMQRLKQIRKSEMKAQLDALLLEIGLTEDEFLHKEEERIKSSCNHFSKKI